MPGPGAEGRVLSTLGLCRRARQLICGTDMIVDALRTGGKACPELVVRASDASENTCKRLGDKCRTYGVRLVCLSADGETLARAVGKTGSLAAVGVTGELARAVLAAYEATLTQEDPGKSQ